MSFTSRDAQIVEWIGLMGAAGAEHVAERFDMPAKSTYVRMRALCDAGLLAHRTVLHGWPGMYSATRSGLRWQGLGRLALFRINPSGFEHTWKVASAAVALHRALPGWRVIPERELRMLEAEEGKLLASVRVGSIGSNHVLHRPDLAVLAPTGRMLAIEVELSVKAPRRLLRICRGWGRAAHLGHVYYLATPQPARAVRRAVRGARVEDCVTVLGLEGVPALAARELGGEGACDALAA